MFVIVGMVMVFVIFGIMVIGILVWVYVSIFL